MFKNLKKSWDKLNNEENFSLVEIRVGDILFTPLKRKAKKYNKNFPNNLSWSDDQIVLRGEIEDHKYDSSNQDKPMSISKDGVCLNGHHRTTSLLEYYGEDYVVKARKLNVNYRYIIFLTVVTIIFQPKLLKSQ